MMREQQRTRKDMQGHEHKALFRLVSKWRNVVLPSNTYKFKEVDTISQQCEAFVRALYGKTWFLDLH